MATLKICQEGIFIIMYFQVQLLLTILMQVVASANSLTSRQEEGIGNLLAVAMLAIWWLY